MEGHGGRKFIFMEGCCGRIFIFVEGHGEEGNSDLRGVWKKEIDIYGGAERKEIQI